jgi:signal recognition particle receptor subunit beta
VLLLFANKQDVKGAMTVAEISDALALHTIKKDHSWHIQESCALTGMGKKCYVFLGILISN